MNKLIITLLGFMGLGINAMIATPQMFTMRITQYLGGIGDITLTESTPNKLVYKFQCSDDRFFIEYEIHGNRVVNVKTYHTT